MSSNDPAPPAAQKNKPANNPKPVTANNPLIAAIEALPPGNGLRPVPLRRVPKIRGVIVAPQPPNGMGGKRRTRRKHRKSRKTHRRRR
jgi:hypothetical protein